MEDMHYFFQLMLNHPRLHIVGTLHYVIPFFVTCVKLKKKDST